MALDKLLQKIKTQIGELSGTMENFVDETVQPSADDCEKLRHQMNDLLECLAVYKYEKHQNEISPNFKIHAKISEMSPVDEGSVVEQAREIVHTQMNPVAETVHTPAPKKQDAPPLQININDKFRFINELFSQNSSEYNIVLEQLGSLNSWNETEIYLASLKNVYGWKDNHEVVKHFYATVKRRFN